MVKMSNDKILSILEKYKGMIGFAGWDIKVLSKPMDSSELANVEVDYYEKIVTITLSKKFHSETKKMQINTLVHELVHGRFELYKKRVEHFSSDEEELMVNDITRGLLEVTKDES